MRSRLPLAGPSSGLSVSDSDQLPFPHSLSDPEHGAIWELREALGTAYQEIVAFKKVR